MQNAKGTWHGKDKFHYKVKRGNDIIYRCTSVSNNQEEVIKILIDRYCMDFDNVIIYRNNDIIWGKRYNKRKALLTKG